MYLESIEIKALCCLELVKESEGESCSFGLAVDLKSIQIMLDILVQQNSNTN